MSCRFIGAQATKNDSYLGFFLTTVFTRIGHRYGIGVRGGCVIIFDLDWPSRKWLEEVSFIGVVHHGQVHPGLLKPRLETDRILLLLKREAETKLF